MNKPEHTLPKFNGPPGQPDLPWLLTPGPVTTSRAVKLAMLADFDAVSPDFAQLVSGIKSSLRKIAGVDQEHVCLLLALPRAAVLEAVLSTFGAPRRKKTLVMSNGPSSAEVIEMMERLGRPVVRLEKSFTRSLDVADLTKALEVDKDISHVWLAQSDPTTGILNPVVEICRTAKAAGKFVLLDATFSFSTLPLSMALDGIDVLLTSSEAALDSVPGLHAVLARETTLNEASGRSHSLSLDLNTLAGSKQTSDLPPHLISALHASLQEFEAAGGQSNKRLRRQATATALLTRMKAMGFQPLLKDVDTGPFVQTFLYPRDANFDFEVFSAHLRARGFAIAPGMLQKHKTFRVATMGQVDEKVVTGFAAATEDVLKLMDIRELRPALSND